MSDWDVIVAGAGPAGAVAALVLSQAGRQVLLLDDVDEKARKIGESLPGAARPLLRDLGLLHLLESDVHAPAVGNLSSWGSPALAATDFIHDPHGSGRHLDRRLFDAELRAAAVHAGARWRRARVASVERAQSRIRLRAGDDWFAAPFVLDATGRRAFVARRLGAKRRRDDGLIAVYAWAEAAGDDNDGRTLVEAAPDGWWYTSRLPDGARAVALHADADADVAARVVQDGAEWTRRLDRTTHIRPALAGAPLISRPQATEACGACLDPCGGPGWLATGDAALAFDPLSSQGVFNALYTGLKAAQCLNAMVRGETGADAAYAERLAQIRAAYLRRHRLVYATERRWCEQPFWASRQA